VSSLENSDAVDDPLPAPSCRYPRAVIDGEGTCVWCGRDVALRALLDLAGRGGVG
jgi:hypothetical protein